MFTHTDRIGAAQAASCTELARAETDPDRIPHCDQDDRRREYGQCKINPVPVLIVFRRSEPQKGAHASHASWMCHDKYDEFSRHSGRSAGSLSLESARAGRPRGRSAEPALAEQKRQFDSLKGAQERDLVLVQPLAGSPEAKALRAPLRHDDGTFRAVLIGKMADQS